MKVTPLLNKYSQKHFFSNPWKFASKQFWRLHYVDIYMFKIAQPPIATRYNRNMQKLCQSGSTFWCPCCLSHSATILFAKINFCLSAWKKLRRNCKTDTSFCCPFYILYVSESWKRVAELCAFQLYTQYNSHFTE